MIHFRTCEPEGYPEILVVELTAQLDAGTPEAFFERLEQEISQGHNRLIFDCHNLSLITSLGFGVMIRAHSRLQKAGGAVRFARLEGMIEEAFHVVGFHRLFDNYPTVEAAAASF
ncbi:MAG: STAS domain-containing protein [Planctomycetaceae bacterium]